MEAVFALKDVAVSTMAQQARDGLHGLQAEMKEYARSLDRGLTGEEKLTMYVLDVSTDAVSGGMRPERALLLEFWCAVRCHDDELAEKVLRSLVKYTSHTSFMNRKALAAAAEASRVELERAVEHDCAVVTPTRAAELARGWEALLRAAEAAVEEEPMCALRQVGVLAPKLYDTMSLAVDEAKAACQPAAFFEACAVGIAGVHVAALMCAWLGQTMAEEVSIEDACSAIVTGHESQQRLQYICEKLCAVSMGCLMMSRSLPAGDTKAHLVLRAMFGGSDQSTEGVLPGGVEEAMQEMEAMMGNLCCVTDSEHALKTACVALAQAAHGSRPTRAALDWPLMPLASSDATDAVRAVIAGFRAGMASGSIQGRLVSIGIPTLVCGLAIATEAAVEEEAAVEDTAAERALVRKLATTFQPLSEVAVEPQPWTADLAQHANLRKFAKRDDLLAWWRKQAVLMARQAPAEGKLKVASKRKRLLEALVEACQPVTSHQAAAAFVAYFDMESRAFGKHELPFKDYNLNALRMGSADTAAFFLHILRFWDGVCVASTNSAQRALAEGDPALLDELTYAVLKAEVVLLRYMATFPPPAPLTWPAPDRLDALVDALKSGLSKSRNRSGSPLLRAWMDLLPKASWSVAGPAQGVEEALCAAASDPPSASQVEAMARSSATLLRQVALLQSQSMKAVGLPMTRYERVVGGTAEECRNAGRAMLSQVYGVEELLRECVRLEVLAHV